MAPRATMHRAVISTFSPQMGGRAHDSSRQSIGCQISIVGPALPPLLLRACTSRKRARLLLLNSHDTRRQPPLLSLIGCAHATPTSCICPYLTPIILPCRRCLGPLPLLHRVHDVGAERSGVLPGLPHRKGRPVHDGRPPSDAEHVQSSSGGQPLRVLAVQRGSRSFTHQIGGERAADTRLLVGHAHRGQLLAGHGQQPWDGGRHAAGADGSLWCAQLHRQRHRLCTGPCSQRPSGKPSFHVWPVS